MNHELWMISRFSLWYSYIVNPKKLEPGLRPNGAGIPYASVLRIEAIENYWVVYVFPWTR